MQERPKSPRRKATLKAASVSTQCPKLRSWLWRVERFHVDYAPPYGWHKFLKDGWSQGLDAWRTRYAYYLRSIAWQQRRNGALKRSQNLCDMCHQTARTLQVHHVHYLNVGKEEAEDLRVLCRACHMTVHATPTPLHVPMNPGAKAHLRQKAERSAKAAEKIAAVDPAPALIKKVVVRRPGGVKVSDLPLAPKSTP